LFDLIMKGDAATALAELSGQYADGADPMAVLRDLAEVTHWISVVKITPEAADDPTVPPDERLRGLTMAETLPMRALTRMWQMLLKSIEEVSIAPNAMMAAEMAVIRLTHIADLPDPEQLLRRLSDGPGPSTPAPQGRGPAPGNSTAHAAPHAAASHADRHAGITATGQIGSTATALAMAPDMALARYATFPAVLELIRANRDVKLQIEVENYVRLVRYAPGRIEFEPAPHAPRDLAATLAQRLQSWTGTRWGVSVVSDGGAPTISERREETLLAAKAEAMENPLVKAVFVSFPDAEITAIKTLEDARAEAAVTALPEVEDEWDPFEES
jgi:DNA polymerase-3 subunit gamma/tau